MENIILIVSAMLIITGVLGFLGCWFFKLEKQKQIEILKEWLLLAVIRAEKELGGGTGQVKLRYVYDLFIDKFGFLARVLSFEQFSMYVDEALELMKHIIASNQNVELYIMKHE